MTFCYSRTPKQVRGRALRVAPHRERSAPKPNHVSTSKRIHPGLHKVGVWRRCCAGMVLEAIGATSSSGNTRLQSCQLAEPLWTDPGLKSGSGVREPTSTSNNNNKKAQAGNEFSNLSVRSSRAREEKKTKKKKLIITLSTTEQNVRAAHSFSRRSGSFQPIFPCLAIIISLHTQAFEG